MDTRSTPSEIAENQKVGFDISGLFEVPVEWEVLVSVSDDCLDGYAPDFVEKEIVNDKLPASITYRIWQEELLIFEK